MSSESERRLVDDPGGGRQIRYSIAKFAAEYRGLTESDLTRALNEREKLGRKLREQFLRESVLPCGLALIEMRRRVRRATKGTKMPDGRRNHWRRWVEQNFDGSLAQDRLYRQVARNWDKIAAAGLDRDGVTLAEVRKFLKTLNPRDAAAAGMPPDPPPPANITPVEIASPSPDNAVQMVFVLRQWERERLEVMLKNLEEDFWFNGDTRNDVLFAALSEVHRLFRGDE